MKAATLAPVGRTFQNKGWGCAKDAEHNLLQAPGNRGGGWEALGVNGRDLGAGSALAGGFHDAMPFSLPRLLARSFASSASIRALIFCSSAAV